MAENKKRSVKSFFMKKGYNKSGKEVADGAVKLFVKKAYGTNDVFITRAVQINGEARRVGNVTGSVLVDEYTAKALKYNLNADVPADMYVNVKLAFWDKKAELFEKWNINEGDLVMFFCSSFTYTTFDKRDGSTGYQIEGNVYDWDVVKKNKQQEQAQTSATRTGDMAAVAESDFNAEGFVAIEDDGDLPF